MKFLLASVAILVSVTGAQAQVSINSDGTVSTHIGSVEIRSDGTTVTNIGSTAIRSDGAIGYTYGAGGYSTTHYSDGSSSSRFGVYQSIQHAATSPAVISPSDETSSVNNTNEDDDDYASQQRQRESRNEELRSSARAKRSYELRNFSAIEIPGSWDGEEVNDVVEVSSYSKARGVLVHSFGGDGQISAGGFAIVPNKTKADWIHVEWSKSTDGQQRCYARHATSSMLAFGGLPVNSRICEAILPSRYVVQQAKDTKYYCYEVGGDAIVNGGMPVDPSNCTNTIGELTASYYGVGFKSGWTLDTYYGIRLKGCLKAVHGQPVNPTVVAPAEFCPSLSMQGAVYRRLAVALKPQYRDYGRAVGLPLEKTVCTLYDEQKGANVAMQIDASKCSK